MAHQKFWKIFHGPHKNPPAPPPTYLMYRPLPTFEPSFQILFRNSGKFPSEWKKANVVPVFKKGDKQLAKNNHPISLLPITGKIFERLFSNQIFEFFIRNKLISQNQSGFIPSDSLHKLTFSCHSQDLKIF